MKIARNSVKLILSILLCLGIGVLSISTINTNNLSWYQTLDSPFTLPIGLVIAIVIFVYLLMGLAFYIIISQPRKYRKDPEKKKSALLFFSLQLILCLFWQYFFFGLQSPIAGLMEIFVLLGFASITIIKFYQLHEKAAYLLMPYLLWLCFATLLNFWIVILN